MLNASQDAAPALVLADLGIAPDTLRFIDQSAKSFGADELVETASRFAADRNVICVCTTRDMALRVSALPGVLPLWLADRSVNPFSDPSVAIVHELAEVAAYFQPNALPFLGLTRWRPSDTRAKLAQRIETLLTAARAAGGITIYGAGTIGRQALDAARMMGLPVKAFLDGNAKLHGSQIDGVDVRPVASLAKGSDVVVPALGRHLESIAATLKKAGVHTIMTLSELYYASRRPGEPETDYLDDLYANRNRYQSLFMAAADTQSRNVLSAVMVHRLTLETAPLTAVVERGHPQWFDPAFLPRTDRDVFVDGGAYDGDTAIGYVEARGPGYQHVHAFELDPDVAARAMKRTVSLPNVTIHNCGLSDREDMVTFRKTGGTDGAVGLGDVGEQRVALRTIDGTITERITFLKLDVEGEEARTIDGGRRHIVEDRPTLAIALYHKAHDLWDIPRRILDLCQGYRLYFRHYTDIAYETVVYAIPTP